MQSNILFISILVAVQVNYINSEDLKIHICHDDVEAYYHACNVNLEVVPILVVSSLNENPLNDEKNMKMIKDFYELNNIKELLLVPADKCGITSNILFDKSYTKEQYPIFFVITRHQLVPGRWPGFSFESIRKSFEKGIGYPALQKGDTYIRLEYFIGMERNRIMTSEAARTEEQAQLSAVTQIPVGTQTIGQIRPYPNQPLNLMQPLSYIQYPILTFQPTPWTGAPARILNTGPTIGYPASLVLNNLQHNAANQAWVQSMFTRATSSVTPDDDQPTRPTLNLFENVPTGPVANPVTQPPETLNLLSKLEQQLEELNKKEGGSSSTPSQKRNIQFIEKDRSSKKIKKNDKSHIYYNEELSSEES